MSYILIMYVDDFNLSHFNSINLVMHEGFD